MLAALILTAGCHTPLAQTANNRNAPINAFGDIAPAISACWNAPHPGDQVTIRLSFRRDGALIGRPRVSFMKANGKPGTENDIDVANSILKAIYACTPLHVTPAFGASLAGRVLSIRFIAAHPTTPERRA